MGKRLMTKQVCEKLKVKYATLYCRIRAGILAAPERDDGGRMWWSAADVERARKSLAVDRRHREHRGKTLGNQR
jgi:hypothetical protein